MLAEADGTSDPALEILLAYVRFAEKKLKNPMTRAQKLDHVRKAGHRAIQKGPLISALAVQNVQVEVVAQVATSIAEANELLRLTTKGNAKRSAATAAATARPAGPPRW